MSNYYRNSNNLEQRCYQKQEEKKLNRFCFIIISNYMPAVIDGGTTAPIIYLVALIMNSTAAAARNKPA